MEIIFTQLIPLALALWILLILRNIYKAENKVKASKWLLLPVSLAVISLAFMPVKITQRNMSAHEDSSKFDNVPEKVIIAEKTFDESQTEQFNKLKKESNNEK